MPSGRGFPWRWVIAGLAIAVIALTILVPPPGTLQEQEDPVSLPEPDIENDTDLELCTPDTIRVLVLNGTWIDGLAGRTQRQLLHSSTDSTIILAPFDPSDADVKPYEETVIISHLTDISAAVIISDILGKQEDNIVWEVPVGNTPLIVDVTVCLGEDMDDNTPSPE
jgi:hypothetical protein